MGSAVRRALGRALPPLPPLDRRTRWALTVIVAVGAVLRAWWVTKAQAPTELRDPALYLLLGGQLADGNGYSYPGAEGGVTAYYPPGYPLMLGGLMWLLRPLPGELSVFDVALGANVVLSLATIVLVFSLGRRLVDHRVGLAAAAIFALWPNLILHTGLALTETLFMFLFVLMLLVALANREVARHPGRWRLVAVGVLFGLTGLVRPVSFVIAPLFLLLWWPDGVRRAVRNVAIVGVATLALVLPWTVRNVVQMDSPILLSANFGDNFCIGNNPDANGGYALWGYCFEGLAAGERPDFEVDRQNETLRRGLRWVRQNPVDAVALGPDRLWYTLREDDDGLEGANDFGFHPIMSEGTEDALRWASNGWYVAIVLLAAAGLAVSVSRGAWGDRRWTAFVLMAPVQLVSPLVTFGEPRFKMPIYPVLAVAAAVAVVTIIRRDPDFPGAEGTATDAGSDEATADADEGDGEGKGEGDPGTEKGADTESAPEVPARA